MVGVERFELTTLWSQTRCANQAALYPETADGNTIISANQLLFSVLV